ncbi:MAG TPA: hypothetical protein VMU95_41845 [Trebonia sp.]|nr:hypothetical protein [Trebonia sp.]
MGRKTLLTAALSAALAGLVACGTTTSTGTSASSAQGPATTTGPASSAATQPPRPVADTTRLPSGIHAVRITLVPGANDKTTPPGPVTVTQAAKVGQLVALVNGLSPAPSGPVHSCPMEDGRGVRLTYLSAPGGAPLATAFAAGNGCGGVTLTVGTRDSSLGSGNGPAARALAIGGIRWNVWGPA